MGNRIKSIDVLRGLSVILMVTGHIYYIWTNNYKNIYGEIINFIVISAAPIFPLVSGFGFYHFINNRIQKETPKIKIFKEVLIRAGFIFLISTSLLFSFGQIVGYQFTSIIYWSIFQLISVCMIIFYMIPLLKKTIRLSLYIILFFSIFLISHIIFLYEIEFLYILVNVGNFPILPWANFFLLGIFIGDLMVNLSQDDINRYLLVYLSIGICLMTAYFLGINSITYLYLDIFFKNLGIFFISFSILYYYLDVKGYESSLQNRVIQWGKVAFSVYYIHFGIIGVGLFLFPLIINNIYSNGFNIFQYFILVVLVLISLEIFLRIWQKFNFIFGIEWTMSKFTQKSLYHERVS